MNQEQEFKIGEDEQPATVSLSEDGKAEVLEKPEAPDVVVPAADGADKAELDQYSDNVKKRIDKLTARLRETQRREEAALAYARGVQQQALVLQQQAMEATQQRLGEAKSRIETQAIALKQIIKKAREEGDIDTETEAQERLASLVHDQRQVEAAEAHRASQAQQPQNQAPQGYSPPQNGYQAPQALYQQIPQYQQPQPPQQAQRVDPRAEAWAEKNSWFGKDTVLTHAAWGIHRQLISMEGFDPSSDEYYDELDRRMRDAFPQRFKQSDGVEQNRITRNVQPVAPASRSSGINQTARRTVRLTPSQVAIAKKLGVPLEEYAKYVKE